MHGRSVTPLVVEPSFGVGRIITAILEHSFYVRPGDQEQRTAFRFNPAIAPVQVGVAPLIQKEPLPATAKSIVKALRQANVTAKLDDTGVAVGRKYARFDEAGVPFVVTVDFAEDGSVTLRERDSMR